MDSLLLTIVEIVVSLEGYDTSWGEERHEKVWRKDENYQGGTRTHHTIFSVLAVCLSSPNSFHCTSLNKQEINWSNIRDFTVYGNQLHHFLYTERHCVVFLWD